MENIQVGKHQAFEVKDLQMASEQKGYMEFCKKLEDDRCNADLMYRLFRRPEEVVDKLLPGLVEIIKTKNSPDLEESGLFVDAKDFLLYHPRACTSIKLFAILVVVAHEVEAQNVIKAGYKAEGNIWEDKWEKHLTMFFKDLVEVVGETFNTSFGETNIMERVKCLNIAAELRYLSNYK